MSGAESSVVTFLMVSARTSAAAARSVALKLEADLTATVAAACCHPSAIEDKRVATRSATSGARKREVENLLCLIKISTGGKKCAAEALVYTQAALQWFTKIALSAPGSSLFSNFSVSRNVQEKSESAFDDFSD
jgi:hypothetical protein